MMNFFVRKRGSISIFLAIILLPCLAFTGILVDLANMSLSKSIVESAGTLTTNAALANYDTVLEDVYGLFAMSQRADNPEEALKENLNNYFTNSLMANGLMENDAKEFSSQLMGELYAALYSDGDINENFIKIHTKNFEANYVENSSLANPEILRNQIVEFMKYRGPAEVGLSVLDSLASLKKSNLQTPVVNQKLEVDKAISEMAKICQKFYNSLVQYDKEVSAYKKEEEKYFDQDVPTRMENLHSDILKYLTFEVVNIDDVKFISDEGAVTAVNSVDRATFDNLVSNVEMQENIAKLKEYASNMDQYLDADAPNTKQIYEAFELYRTKVYPNYIKKLIGWKLGLPKRIRSMERQIKSWENCDDENHDHSDDIEEMEKELSLYEEVLEYSESNLSDLDQSVSSILEKAKPQYQSMVTEAKTRSNDNATHVFGITNEMWRTGNVIVKTGFLGFGGNEADQAIGYGEQVIEKMEKVVTENEKLKVDIGEYTAGIDKNSDDFSSTMSSNQDKVASQYKPNDVQEIMSQLEAGKVYMIHPAAPTGIIPSLEAWKFYDIGLIPNSNMDPQSKPVEDIVKNLTQIVESKLEDEIESERKESGISNEYVKQKYEENVLFPEDSVLNREAMNPYPSATCYLKRIGEAKIEVSGSTETFNVPPFYIYLVTTYGYTREEDGGKKEIDEMASEKTKKAKEQTEVESKKFGYDSRLLSGVPSEAKDLGGSPDDNEIKYETESSSKEMSQSGMDQFTAMGESSNSILGILNGTLENVRDNALVTAYVMSNFSSFAYTMEKDEGADPPLDPVGNTERKTMTNFPIDKGNNVLFGCEAEYITYGIKGEKEGWWIFSTTKGPEANVARAKRDIYAVRMVFNSVYALTDTELDNFTKPPALAIQAASQGFIPYQFSQVVIKLALALAESAVDLDDIVSGKI